MSSILAVDTETHGLQWWSPSERAFLISWAGDDYSDVTHIEDPAGMARFHAALEQATTVVAHNLKFDVHQLRETIGLDLLTSGKTLIDTLGLAQVVVPERRFAADEEAGYRLKALAKTYVSGDAQDAEAAIEQLAEDAGIKLKSTGGYYETWRAYPAEMEHYAKVDTEITRDLLPKLQAKITAGLLPITQLERDVLPHLITAEQRGIRVDQTVVAPLQVEYEKRAAEAHERVVAVLGEDALEGNNALLDALLAQGVPLHRKTDTGKLATNKFALAEFEKDYPVVADLAEWRTATKFLATYLNPMSESDVIHTSFNPQGSWTGRMSCSRPNLMNVPVRAGSEIREAFIPREGHSFVVCDFDSIELRLLAYYLNDAGFREKVARGDDVFAELAAFVAPVLGYDVDYGTDPANYRKGMPGDKRRNDCKQVTYALIYGAGGPRISDMLGIPLADGKRVGNTVKSWLPGYDDLAGYKGRIRKKVEGSGYVTTIMGRKQPIKKDKSYIGLSGLIQGSAADVFKQAIINTAAAIKHLDGVPILFVHDEIISEVPTEHAEECLALQRKAMNAAWDLNPPLEVSGTIAHKSWAEGK